MLRIFFFLVEYFWIMMTKAEWMVRSRLRKEKSEDGLKMSFMRKGINPVSAKNWLQKWWI